MLVYRSPMSNYSAEISIGLPGSAMLNYSAVNYAKAVVGQVIALATSAGRLEAHIHLRKGPAHADCTEYCTPIL